MARAEWRTMGGIKLITREKGAEESEAILSQKTLEEQGGTEAQGA
jgi:hypothetical protein